MSKNEELKRTILTVVFVMSAGAALTSGIERASATTDTKNKASVETEQNTLKNITSNKPSVL